MSPDLPVLTVVFLIVSWTTCGALAILLSYLYYVFKVCASGKPEGLGFVLGPWRLPQALASQTVILLSAALCYIRKLMVQRWHFFVF